MTADGPARHLQRSDRSLTEEKRTLRGHRNLFAFDPRRILVTVNCRSAKGSLDHLVGGPEQRLRNAEAKSFWRSLRHTESADTASIRK